MINFTELLTTAFYVVLLIICVFIVVHAALQIKNNQYTFKIEPNKKKKNDNKMIKIIVIGLVLFSAIFFKILNSASSFKASASVIDNYQETVEQLDAALSLEFSAYKGGTYTSASKLAHFMNRQLPIKSAYYLFDAYGDVESFSKYEIMKFKLDEFENNPTLITYDGVLMSIIKFKEGCKYINKKIIGKSDCIIEIDVNNFAEPNQIGQDRTLFAIDGENNSIYADYNFFRK